MTIKTISHIELTPELMAEAFWAMNSEEQAKFFSALSAVIKSDDNPKSVTYSLGELQWFYMGDQLEGDKPARDMLMAMAAPLYLHTLNYTETQQ